VQLRHIRIGQPARVVADLYGKKVEYKGTVSGVGIGTGAAFSLLPAQNATGNWIKVVQRVPVRIALDAQQLAGNPLRVGLSMDVDIDVTNQSGKVLADVPVASPLASALSEHAAEAANADVRRVNAANAGTAGIVGKSKPASPAVH
jgi:membrane fusion protein (multidrug efflux system)